MTIRFPRKTLGDKVLWRLGKRRAVSFPTEGIERYGVYVATIEPFLRALLALARTEMTVFRWLWSREGIADIRLFDEATML